jgi:hypothetical protein
MILALDLATVTGWAIGEPGQQPKSGVLRFGRGNTTHGQIAAEAIAWMIEFLSEMKPDQIVFEQPLPPNFTIGHTTLNTAMIAMGLPFVLQGIAYKLGMFNVTPVTVSEVRNFFIGGNFKSAEAKKLTFERCKRMGFAPQDDNASDALALWCYQCARVRPELAHQLTPLFGGAQLHSEPS